MTTATASRSRHQLGWDPAALPGGVSEFAQQIGSHVRQVWVDACRTASGQGFLLAQPIALMDNYSEAKALAANGESLAPSPAALREAHSLLAALPSWAPKPNPIIEPSGAIAFEWDLGPSRFLVFAVKGTGTIEHSAILGLGNEVSGTTNFAGTLGSRELAMLFDLAQMRD